MVLSLVLLTVTLQASPLPANGSQQQKPANQIQNTSGQSPTEPTIPVTDDQNAAAREGKSASNQAPQRPEKPPWWDATWATWALVIVGFCGTLAALWTLFIIRDQTEAIKTSSDALVNSERAWIDGTFIWSNLTKRWSLNIKNHGKTPAHIHGYEIGFGWFAKTGEQPSTHDLRFNRSVVENLDVLLGSAQDQPVHDIDPVRDFSNEAFAEKNSVLMHVKVKYWDTVTVGDSIRTPRHTEFVYVLDRLTSKMQRMPQYTKYE